VFLLSKGPRYFYDADAVREEPTDNPGGAAFYRAKGQGMPDYEKRAAPEKMSGGHAGFLQPTAPGRNKRSVWTVATQPYAGAHFATFPAKLIEPCILAGSRSGDAVLDPFAGSGTTGVVCGWHGREFIGCELNPEYAAMAEARIALEGRPGGKPAHHEPAVIVAEQMGLL
jgi:DNA modification methylase